MAAGGDRVDPTIKQAYDRWGNVTSYTDADNNVTTYTYNYNNQLASETGPETDVYTESNVDDPIRAAVRRTISYDILGRAAKEDYVAYNESTVIGTKSKYQLYDRAGNVIRTVDATNKGMDYAYDIHSNKVGVRDGMGTVQVYEYNKNGQVTKHSLLRQSDQETVVDVSGPYGNTAVVYSTREYNSFNASQTAAKKVELNRYAYDQAGNVYAAYNTAGNAEYYKYDARGNLKYKQDVMGSQTRYLYDEFGNKVSEDSLMSVSANEQFIYGYTTTNTAQEGSTPNYGTQTITYQDGYRFVSEVPYGVTNATPVYGEREVEFISGYHTTSSAQRGSTEIWDTRQVEFIYGYTTTTTAQRGSEAIYSTREVEYQSGTQVVTQQPYGGTYTPVYSTRQVEYIDGYQTTTTSQRGSTEIWDTRQVEYVYGYTTTSTAQRGSEAIYATRQVQYQSGTQVVSQQPNSGMYTTLYGTRQVEYIDGYTTTTSSQRGSTEIWGTRQVEYVYGYTTTSTSQRGSTPIYSTRTEQYISHYTSGPYGQQIPVYATRTVQYVSGYKTPIYRTRTEDYFTGTYRTPVYKTRNEQYITGYEIPVYSTRTETYIKEYKTPIYRTRTEDYFTGTYRTPIYKTRSEQYVSGYEVPVYSTRTETYVSGYNTPIYRTRTEDYFTGNYRTPIYSTRMEEYLTGYNIPNMLTREEEYIVNYTTPIYAYRTVRQDDWVGNTWTYHKEDYKIGLLDERHLKNVSGDGIVSSTIYDYSYNDFGQMKTEQTRGKNTSVVYDYWENGLLERKSDQEILSATKTYKVESSYKYDIRGLRTVEEHFNVDSTSRLAYGVTVTSDLDYGMKTHYSYDELGRLTNVNSPSDQFKAGTYIKSTADLQSLEYKYDHWGNRRAIEATYELSGMTGSVTKKQLFAYDAEGRTLVANGYIQGGRIVAGRAGGVAFEYDGAGRVATEQAYGFGTTFNVKQSYYNDLGLLSRVERSQIQRVGNTHLHSESATQSGTREVVESHVYDNRGFRTTSVVNGAKSVSTYRDDGQLLSQTHYDNRDRIANKTQNYDYSAGGQLLSYDYLHYKTGTYEFTNHYEYRYTNTYAGSQVESIYVDSTQERTDTGTTTNYYDHRGRLVRSRIEQSNPDGDETGYSNKYFSYNAEDRVIASLSRRFGTNDIKTQSYFYTNGNPLADFGDEGNNISPINSQYKGGNIPVTYSINAGDSLSSIAQTLFGDGSLWYVIADANALNVGPTDRFGSADAGRTLRIPNTNQSVRNDSTSFRPYNSGEVIGDLTPSPEILPPPKGGGGCNALASIIMIVVAVVVTVITAGAAAVAMTAMAQGAAVGTALSTAGMAGIWAAGGAALAGASIGAAAIGGFVGSLASQGVGVAMGVQDKISLRSAFASSMTTAFTAGIGSAAGNSSSALHSTGKFLATKQPLNYFARGAATYVANQGANRMVGLDTSFSWKGMAATAVGYAAGNSLADQLNIGMNSTDFWGGAARASIVGSTTGKLSKQWTGASPNYAQIAIDAFGNQIANSISEGIGKWSSNKTLQAEIEADAAAMHQGISEDLQRANDKKFQATLDQALGEQNDAIDQRQHKDAVAKGTAALDHSLARQESQRAQRSEALLAGYEAAGQQQDIRLGRLADNQQRLDAQIASIGQVWDDFHAGVKAQAAQTSAQMSQIRVGVDFSNTIAALDSYNAHSATEIAAYEATFGPRRAADDYLGQARDVGSFMLGGLGRFGVETVTSLGGLATDFSLTGMVSNAYNFAVTGEFRMAGLEQASQLNQSVSNYVGSFGPGNLTAGWLSDDLNTAYNVGSIFMPAAVISRAPAVVSKTHRLVPNNVPPIKGGGLGGGGNGPTLIRTSDIAPTQAEVNILRGDGVSIVDKASDIRMNGFDPAEAIDVIKVDGGYLTLDHRRLESAVWAGEDYIPGNIHLYTDRVSPNVANRFEFYGDAPFSDLTTRNTFRLGDTPSTWGEAALVRTVNQQYSRAGNLVRDYPNFKFGQAPTYMSAPGDATGKAWMEYIRALQNSSN